MPSRTSIAFASTPHRLAAVAASNSRADGATLSDRGHGGRGRAAAEGPAVVGDECRVRHDEPDPLGRDPELLGGGLGQFGAGSLTAFDLAGHHGEGAVLADVEPCRDACRTPTTHSTAPTLTGRLFRILPLDCVGGHGDQETRAEDMQEVAAGRVGVGEVEFDEVDRLVIFGVDAGR